MLATKPASVSGSVTSIVSSGLSPKPACKLMAFCL